MTEYERTGFHYTLIINFNLSSLIYNALIITSDSFKISKVVSPKNKEENQILRPLVLLCLSWMSRGDALTIVVNLDFCS